MNRTGLQQSRLSYPSPSSRACSKSFQLSRWCHPTISSSVIPFSSCLQSFPASGSFLMDTLCIAWPEYWNFSLSISSSNEYSGFLSFGIDWFDLLAVQGTLKSLLKHHSLKALILCHSSFFMVQLSHPYMTTGQTTALTIWTFVGKMTSLLFNMLSRQWQPTPVFLPGESQGWWSLVGCRLWGRTESDTTEAT